VMGVLRSSASAGGVSVDSEVWVGDGSYIVAQWGITQ